MLGIARNIAEKGDNIWRYPHLPGQKKIDQKPRMAEAEQVKGVPGNRYSYRDPFAWVFDGCCTPQAKGNEIMSTNTIRLHRVLRATPDRIYRAFLDADAMTKWLPPNGFTGKVHHLDAKVGGTHKMSFTNFTTGESHSFGGRYLELVPHERMRYTDKFDDPNLPGEMQVTVTLKKVSVGTELHIVQEGVPDVIPPEACYLGWQESLTLLAKLVDAEIPD
jgi:uncharacterized protein YndB with AHSA1/START domain